MRTYGIRSREELEATWTPAEVMVFTRALQRDEALQAAERMEQMLLACAAAERGGDCYKAFERTVRRLREQAGFEAEHKDLGKMLSGMGLRR